MIIKTESYTIVISFRSIHFLHFQEADAVSSLGHPAVMKLLFSNLRGDGGKLLGEIFRTILFDLLAMNIWDRKKLLKGDILKSRVSYVHYRLELITEAKHKNALSALFF